MSGFVVVGIGFDLAAAFGGVTDALLRAVSDAVSATVRVP
jgi:hypothetical protein